ncbi:PREDICTED: melanoma inhibitory activity protein 2 [Chrysochloris asiatica]|uniref:Melanoma inhibitory activity protein 2 n=1 Tax=Chrysochloris asiatica TaxID=185453 RepID=A0A9B0TB45_CHRAS|nr:PREDICTED: melanoma inhibitory activity protein 2 [Chrysochloris asiatica]
MVDLGVHRILLLVLTLTKSLESTKWLADLKKCGDLECETLISRVLATQDYRGPDCRYLNFTKGEEISVYVKLAGEREDLWAGSKGKDFGYFPRDAVQVEEVFISEEVQVATKESDFLCLLGVSYIFENEDSELNSDSYGTTHPYDEDEDQKSREYESDFHIESEFYVTSESTLLEDQFLADEIRSTTELTDWEEVEARSVEQDIVDEEVQNQISEVDHAPPSLAVPEVKGWFGLRRERAEGKLIELVNEPLQGNSLQSRKIVVVKENDLEELHNDEPQTEHKQEPASEFDHNLKPQATGWFGGGFTNYLGFGNEDSEIELLSKEGNQPLQDVTNPLSSDEEPTVPCTEMLEKKDPITNDSSILKSNWFDFGFGMLGFAYAKEDQTVSYDRKTEEGGRDNKHEHPLANEFGPDKEQEREIIKVLETEDQTDQKEVLQQIDDSDNLPYFKKFLYNFDNSWNFQSIAKKTELSHPKQLLDEDNLIEDDETEEFSVENDPMDNMESMMSESRYSPSDIVSKIEVPMRNHEDVHFKTPSFEDEKSKTLLITEEHTQVENGFVENALVNSQIFSTDNSLSSQKEGAFEFQILKFLFQIDVYDVMNSAFSPIVILKEMVSWTFLSFVIIVTILLIFLTFFNRPKHRVLNLEDKLLLLALLSCDEHVPSKGPFEPDLTFG